MTGGPRAGPEAIGERSMGADDGRIRIGGQHPFATPAEWRSAARRFRGRLVAPVTVWTAGGTGDGAGLTVSSVLVADGEPARLLGLIDPASAFVVHVLGEADRALAERFAEVRPPIRGMFEGLDVSASPWGPVLGGARPRAACRLSGSTTVGYSELVEGVIEEVEPRDLDDPLAWLHGSYRSVRDLDDLG